MSGIGGDLTSDRPFESEELELRTRGRRTGRTHTVRLWFAHEEGALWLRTDERVPDWLRSLRAHPRCTVRIGEREIPARYEPLTDRDAALRHLVAFWRAKYGPDRVQDWYVERGREPVRLSLA